MAQPFCARGRTSLGALRIYNITFEERDNVLLSVLLHLLNDRWPSLLPVCAYVADSLVGITAGMYLLTYIDDLVDVLSGYHRLWSHRSYTASVPLRLFLLSGGSSAVQGSCLWWAKAHRSHHRYTDSDLDPYNSTRGLLWTHIGWVLFKTRSKTGVGNVDIGDLKRDPLVRWQHTWYYLLAMTWGLLLPILVCGLAWGDWKGGLCIAGAARLTLVHHVE